MKNIKDIISQFPEVGEITEIKPLTSGLINQTYLVKTTSDATSKQGYLAAN